MQRCPVVVRSEFVDGGRLVGRGVREGLVVSEKWLRSGFSESEFKIVHACSVSKKLKS